MATPQINLDYSNIKLNTTPLNIKSIPRNGKPRQFSPDVQRKLREEGFGAFGIETTPIKSPEISKGDLSDINIGDSKQEVYDPRLGMFVSTRPQDQFGTSVVTRAPTASESQRLRDVEVRGGILDRPTQEVIETGKTTRQDIKDWSSLSKRKLIQEKKIEELEKGNVQGEQWVGSEKDFERYQRKFEDYRKTVSELENLQSVRTEGEQLFFEPEKIGVKLPLTETTLFEVPAERFTEETRAGVEGQGVSEGIIFLGERVGTEIGKGWLKFPGAQQFLPPDIQEKAGEAVGQTAKYFIPVAGQAFFAAETERQLRTFDYKPVEFVKERPGEAALLGGVILTAGGLRGVKALRGRKLTPLEESQNILKEAEKESARLMRERQKLLSGLRWVEDPTKGIVKRQPATYTGFGERTLAGKESKAFWEGATGTAIKTKDIPPATVDVGLYQQPTQTYRVTQDLFPAFKELKYLDEPIERTQYLFTGTTQVGKETKGLGAAYQIGTRGQPIDRRIVSIRDVRRGDESRTLFQIFESGRRSERTVRTGQPGLASDEFILELFPTGRLVERQQMSSRLLGAQKLDEGVVSRRFITETKDIPTKPQRLFEDDFLKALEERPTQRFGFQRPKEVVEDVVVFGKPRTDTSFNILGTEELAVGTGRATRRQPFGQLGTIREIPEGAKFIEAVERGRIVTPTGKKSSQEFLQSLYQAPKVREISPMPRLTPKITTRVDKPISEVAGVKSIQRPSVWEGTGLYERTTETGVMGSILRPQKIETQIKPLTLDTPTERSILDTRVDTTPRQEVQPRFNLGADVQPRTDFKLLQEPKVSQKPLSRLGERVTQRERLQTRQATKPLLERTIKTKAPLKQKTPLKPRTPKTPKIKLPKIFKSDEEDGLLKGLDEDGFKAFVRKKGEDVELGEFKTLPSARTALKGELLETIRASGFVTDPKGRKVKLDLGSAFRPSKKDSFRIVQRKTQRLGRVGETKEIQFFRKQKSGGLI